ncbi:hypothetical protein VTN02DRAFT_4893 [Thermoascus thermophilus]
MYLPQGGTLSKQGSRGQIEGKQSIPEMPNGCLRQVSTSGIHGPYQEGYCVDEQASLHLHATKSNVVRGSTGSSSRDECPDARTRRDWPSGSVPYAASRSVPDGTNDETRTEPRCTAAKFFFAGVQRVVEPQTMPARGKKAVEDEDVQSFRFG